MLVCNRKKNTSRFFKWGRRFAGFGFYVTKKNPELKEKIMSKIRELSSSDDSQEENKNPTKKADAPNIYGDDDDEVIEDQ